MRYLVTAEEMRRYDQYTIEKIGIPAMVLMERAALAAFNAADKYFTDHKEAPRTVLVMAGPGNNGGDGLALARLLSEKDYRVEVWFVGEESRTSEQWKSQRKILASYPVDFSTNPIKSEYTILIDAMFGVGLSGEMTGIYGDAADLFNKLAGYKIALDLPSGIDSDTGKIWGKAVCADETVTFGFCKRGLVLYPGCLMAGKVTTADIGITERSFREGVPGMYALDQKTEELLPVRDVRGNKGSFGKVLLVAGSVNMAGAAILSAKAAYRMGAGMVKVITPEENRVILQQAVPEALLGTEADLEAGLDWADVIAVGPGIGKSTKAKELLEKILINSKLPLLIDADGLNLVAENQELRRLVLEEGSKGREIALTPHVGELARLLKKNINEVKEHPVDCGSELAMELQTVVAAKDARTFICKKGKPICVNLTGNSGLATAGSGDVLAGMIAGLMAQGMNAYEAACVGTCIHGRAGDKVKAEIGEHACMAGDLLDTIIGK